MITLINKIITKGNNIIKAIESYLFLAIFIYLCNVIAIWSYYMISFVIILQYSIKLIFTYYLILNNVSIYQTPFFYHIILHWCGTYPLVLLAVIPQ